MSSTGSNIMAGMSSVITLAIFLSILVATLAVEGPLVTLGHGGKVRGLSYEFENKTVHHFLCKLKLICTKSVFLAMITIALNLF